MKIFISFILAIICLTFFCCSEESTETPPLDQNIKGKLVVKSNPSGAQIFLMGANTGKTTPETIENLDQGTYNGFLYLQYYDTTYFSAQVFNNTTTTVDTTLEDSLPIVEFIFDYQASGDRRSSTSANSYLAQTCWLTRNPD